MTPQNVSAPLYVLLGDPVQHSLSPALQNAAMRSLGIDAVYVAVRAWRDLVGPLMREVASAGGGGNVTVPHKRVAALALDDASEAVHATGACNVFWWDDDGRLVGDNTDALAFRLAAERLLGSDLDGLRVLLLGAGGAASAVAYSCLKARAERIDIVNRSRTRAEGLVSELGGSDSLHIIADPSSTASEAYDLIVNATSLGLAESDPLPFAPRNLGGGAVLDLVYGPNETPLVRAAREVGLAAQDGRVMLVEQAAASFRRWFDREPPRNVMFEAVGLSA